eukprot:1155595-Pelagomonas_calceolata.AAC.5
MQSTRHRCLNACALWPKCLIACKVWHVSLIACALGSMQNSSGKGWGRQVEQSCKIYSIYRKIKLKIAEGHNTGDYAT